MYVVISLFFLKALRDCQYMDGEIQKDSYLVISDSETDNLG